MSSKASTTIGFERRFNPMLTIAELDAFVAESGSVAAPKPPNLTRIVALNSNSFVGAGPPFEELPAPPDGAQLLDVRPAAAFLAGHVRGALNVPVSGTSFATRAGFVLDPDRDVAVQAASAEEARRAARGLNAVGFLELAGFVLGEGPESIEPVALGELEALLAEGATVIDVREQDERDDGYIAGSRNIPYRLLALCPELPDDRPVITICESGARAAVAASVLAARGIPARPVASRSALPAA